MRIKIIILFSVFVALHYIEGLPQIAGMSPAQLWKLPIIFYLLSHYILTPYKAKNFEKWSFLLAIESFINIETFINISFVIASATKTLTCILFFYLFSNTLRIEMIERIILNLSRFICLTSLLTLLGIITPIEGYESAEQFGVEGQIFYTSLFGTPHAAASYFAISIMVLLFFLYKKKYDSPLEKYFNCSMIVVGLISIFETYVRTGWIMLVVGTFMLFGVKKILTNVKLLFASVMSIIGIFLLFMYNESFMARMTARRIYGTMSNSPSIDMDGSGRKEFWENGYRLWENGNIFEILFGHGYTAVVENNARIMGIRVFSHNQFVDSLSQNGLIAFILLIAVFISQYRFIRNRKDKEHYRLCLAIWLISLIFSFFQNEMCFNYAVLYAAALALLSKSPVTTKSYL